MSHRQLHPRGERWCLFHDVARHDGQQRTGFAFRRVVEHHRSGRQGDRGRKAGHPSVVAASHILVRHMVTALRTNSEQPLRGSAALRDPSGDPVDQRLHVLHADEHKVHCEADTGDSCHEAQYSSSGERRLQQE